MVGLRIEQYTAVKDEIELKMDEADRIAESYDIRYGAEEVFSRVRSRINGK